MFSLEFTCKPFELQIIKFKPLTKCYFGKAFCSIFSCVRLWLYHFKISQAMDHLPHLCGDYFVIKHSSLAMSKSKFTGCESESNGISFQQRGHFPHFIIFITGHHSKIASELCIRRHRPALRTHFSANYPFPLPSWASRGQQMQSSWSMNPRKSRAGRTLIK